VRHAALAESSPKGMRVIFMAAPYRKRRTTAVDLAKSLEPQSFQSLEID
jgi:hypothetical protein